MAKYYSPNELLIKKQLEPLNIGDVVITESISQRGWFSQHPCSSYKKETIVKVTNTQIVTEDGRYSRVTGCPAERAVDRMIVVNNRVPVSGQPSPTVMTEAEGDKVIEEVSEFVRKRLMLNEIARGITHVSQSEIMGMDMGVLIAMAGSFKSSDG